MNRDQMIERIETLDKALRQTQGTIQVLQAQIDTMIKLNHVDGLNPLHDTVNDLSSYFHELHVERSGLYFEVYGYSVINLG